MKRTNILAAIDIGTNSFHLIIAQVSPEAGKFKILEREKEIVRLGSGPTDMKYLSTEAMNRGIETLKRFKQLAESAGAEVRAIGTSAVREALNREVFLRRVKSEVGLRIEATSGFEEGRLIYLGVLQALPIYDKLSLVVDIGGGSTEFVVAQRRRIFYSNSLKLGAVRLTERFFPNDKITDKAIKECREYVTGMLHPVMREIRKYPLEVVAGSSGTITTVANIIRASEDDEEIGSLNNFEISSGAVRETVKGILRAKDSRDRRKIDGMDPTRSDIIVAGAIILERIFDDLKIKEMIVSEYALREGIILDAIEKGSRKDVSHLSDIRHHSVIHLAENFHYEREHSHHVADLALKIFNLTKRMHKLGEEERQYLEAAAILHEIGLYISHAQHHRHAYYLIRNSEMFGFTENEKEIIASVARYHRKSYPKLKHENFASLEPSEREVVQKLAGILRIADGLDRTHASVINDVAVRKTRGALTFLAKHRKKSPADLELWGADRKKELFEKAFNVKVQIKARAG